MSFDRLPVEILMKIFSYLPYYDKVSLVNKHFYNVVCTLRDPKIWLRLNTWLFKKKNIEMLQSIKKTKRNVRRVSVYLSFRTDPVAIKTIIAIMRKFSATINHLSIDGNLEMSDFLEMLSIVPKAEHIDIESIRFLSYHYKHPVQKKRRIMPTNEDLNLHHLKTLNLTDCSDDFVIVFNRLPAGVLTELKLDHWNLDQLNELFIRQTNIKKISLRTTLRWSDNSNKRHPIAVDILDNQKLDSVEWNLDSFHLKNVETVLSKQSQLKSLKLNQIQLGEDFMNKIMNQLTGLETLLIYIPETPVAAFKNIHKLTKLKHLTLQSDESRNLSHLEEFASQDNSRISTLDIQFVFNVSDELIDKLAKSVPKLKVLRFNSHFNYKIFNAVMRCFNFIEVLDLDPLYRNLEYYYYDDVESTLIKGDCFNPNLTELKITYLLPYKRVFLKKLIKDYPNLKKLVFRSKTFLNVSQFKLILSGFKNLESLTVVEGASKFTLDDLSCLKEYKNRLKYISLPDLCKIKYVVRTKKKFSSIFDVIKISDFEGFKMAVNQSTMKAEGIEYHY